MWNIQIQCIAQLMVNLHEKWNELMQVNENSLIVVNLCFLASQKINKFSFPDGGKSQC